MKCSKQFSTFCNLWPSTTAVSTDGGDIENEKFMWPSND